MSIKSSQKLKKILEVVESFVSGLNLTLNERTDSFSTFLFLLVSSDYLGAWKLHEQQQKRSGVRIQAAEFRLGELPLSAFKSLDFSLQTFYEIIIL